MSLHPADDVIPGECERRMREGWLYMMPLPRRDHQYILYDTIWRGYAMEAAHQRCDDL